MSYLAPPSISAELCHPAAELVDGFRAPNPLNIPISSTMNQAPRAWTVQLGHFLPCLARPAPYLPSATLNTVREALNWWRAATINTRDNVATSNYSW